MKKKYLLGFIPLLILASCGSDNTTVEFPNSINKAYNWDSIANVSTNSQITHFWDYTNHYFKGKSDGSDDWQGYWPQAHALDLMLDAYERDPSGYQKTVITDWYDGVKAKNNNGTFWNMFYDDMGWNAIATLRAYELTNDARYKTAAEQLWGWIKDGWSDNICGGGVSWVTYNMEFKNAPATCPAGIFAARMYEKFGNTEYLDFAKKCCSWVRNTLFNPSSGGVYDGITKTSSGDVLSTAYYSYNQGIYIGLCMELYKITKESIYLNDSKLAADFCISHFVDSNTGVMSGTDNGDGGLFNGIFIRYFTQLILCDNLSSKYKKSYSTYINKCATVAWTKGCLTPDILFSNNWGIKPSLATYGNPNIAACTLIEAAALLKRKGFIY